MHFSLHPGRYHKRSERNSRGSSTRINFKDIKLGTSSNRKVFLGRASAVKPYWIFAKEWQEKDYRDKLQQQMFSISREVYTPCFNWWGWIRHNHFCRQMSLYFYRQLYLVSTWTGWTMGVNEFHFTQQNTAQHSNNCAKNCAQSLCAFSMLLLVLARAEI